MFFFYYRSTHTAHIGPVDVPAHYECHQCSASSAAMVRTQVTGSAEDQPTAEKLALYNLQHQVYLATRLASCPSCGAIPADRVAEVERARGILARRKKLRWPASLAAAAGVVAVLGVFAWRDFANSRALFAICFGCTALAWGMVWVALSRQQVIAQTTSGTSLWIWGDARADAYRSEKAWVPATPSQPPMLEQPPFKLLVVGFMAALPGFLLASIGVVWFALTFQTLYVVNASPDGSDLAIQVDGEDVGTLKSGAKPADDISWDTFTIRTGESRSVDIVSTKGAHWHYTVDPSGQPLLAPGATGQHLCLLGSSVTYETGNTTRGRSARPQGEWLNQTDAESVRLPRRYDTFFSPPPKTVPLQSGEKSKVQWQLRALDCDSADPDHEGPTLTFRAAKHQSAANTR